jgi:hypothetical protein
MVSIHMNPSEIDDRVMPGHWEDDFIRGAGNQSSVCMPVERTSRPETAWREWWRFLAAMSAGGCVNDTIYNLTILAVPDVALLPFPGVALCSLAWLAVNFASARWWVFRHRPQQ